MARKVVLIVSFLSAFALGWAVFRSSSPTAAVIHAAFLLCLAVFLACVVAECRGAIARSTRSKRRPVSDELDPYHAERTRVKNRQDATSARHDASGPSSGRSEYRSIGRMTG